MKKTNYLIISTAIFIVCTFIIAPKLLYAFSKEVVVGVYDNKPMIFMSDSGPKGLFIDVLENIAKKEGWKINYQYEKWNDLLDRVKHQSIDLLPAVAFKESRKKDLDFTKEILVSNWGQVYTRKDLHLNSIQDMFGKKIAVRPNDIHGEHFKNLLANLGIEHKILLIDNYIDILDALDSKKCDAGVVNHINAMINSKNFDVKPTPIVFNPIQIHYAVPKGDPANLLSALDKYILTFKTDKDSVYHQSMANWFGRGSSQYEFSKWSKWSLISALIIGILLMTGNFFLRLQVKNKTRELTSELEKGKIVANKISQSNEQHRKLISNISDVIAIMDGNGIVKYKSSNIKKHFGWDANDLIGEHGLYTTHPDDKKRIENQLISLLKNDQKSVRVEYRYRCKDGSFKPIELTAVNLLNDPVISGILANYKDITERKYSEDILKQSEEKYRTMIEHSNDMIWTLDLNGNFTFLNIQTQKTAGLYKDEWIGKSFAPLIMAEDASMVENVFKKSLKGESVQYELRFKKQDGQILIIEVNTAPILKNGIVNGVVSFGRDITKQRKLESQLQQNQKMEAIGTLAGGIAHDFNNILSGIFGYSQLAKTNIESPEKANHHINQIVKGAHRATELTRQILTFSRQTEYKKQPFKIYREVNEALKLIRSSIPTTIEIKKNLISKEMVQADPLKIHQVIMNLCTNAYHAMINTGGILTVSLTNVEIFQSKDMKNGKIQPGEYIKLEVSDTGDGMDEKTMEKAFDPYYTTKEIGEGTGLGLAIVLAIVDEHGGYLEVISKQGTGTNFYIYFPVSAKKVDGENPLKKESVSFNGTETILFVDDEDSIRKISKAILEKYGYKIVLSNNGIEALKEFEKNPEQYDLVITDMSMPEMAGDKLTIEIQKIRPDIPILLCTGFSDTLSEEKIASLGVKGLLIKPIVINELANKIREVLGSATAAI